MRVALTKRAAVRSRMRTYTCMRAHALNSVKASSLSSEASVALPHACLVSLVSSPSFLPRPRLRLQMHIKERTVLLQAFGKVLGKRHPDIGAKDKATQVGGGGRAAGRAACMLMYVRQGSTRSPLGRAWSWPEARAHEAATSGPLALLMMAREAGSLTRPASRPSLPCAGCVRPGILWLCARHAPPLPLPPLLLRRTSSSRYGSCWRCRCRTGWPARCLPSTAWTRGASCPSW